MAFRWVTLVLASAVAAGACTAGGGGDSGRGGSGGVGGATGGFGGTTGGVGGATGGVGGMTGGVGGVAGEGGMAGNPMGGTGGGMPPVFDAGSDPLRNEVTPGELCERMSTIQCAAEAFCCVNPGRDEATCKQTMLQGCNSELLLDAIAGNAAAGFNEAAARDAFTEYERLASICDPNVAQWGASTGGLRGIMKGSVPPGGNCAPPGFDITNPSPPTMMEAAIALASCNTIESSACLPGALSWKCEARVGAGPKCFTDVNCQDGLFCDNPDLTPTSHDCVPRKQGGAPCANPNECASLACRGGMCAAVGDVQAAYCLK